MAFYTAKFAFRFRKEPGDAGIQGTVALEDKPLQVKKIEKSGLIK